MNINKVNEIFDFEESPLHKDVYQRLIKIKDNDNILTIKEDIERKDKND